MYKILIISIFSYLTLGQTQYGNPAQNNGSSLEDEIIKQLNGNQSVFDQRVKKMFERLQQNGAMGSMSNLFAQPSTVKTFWKQTDKKYKFYIETVSDKDNFEIDIKDQLITISGKKVIEDKNVKGTSTSSFTFSKSESIPQDADTKSANFIREKGYLIIEFLKKKMLPVPGKDI